MRISKHYTLEQLEHSDTAAVKKMNNRMPLDFYDNARRLGRVLDSIAERFGAFGLNSGYRCAELNKAVGGVASSAHTTGCAADLSIPNKKTQFEVMAFMKNSPEDFDQAIVYPERGFIHIGVATDAPTGGRRQLLLSAKKGIYRPYK